MADRVTRVDRPLEPHEAPVVMGRTCKSAKPKLHQVIDLFCGAGGMAEGFRLAGFDAVVGVDVWEPACQTFHASHPSATVLLGDITVIPPDQIMENAGVKPREIGVICGGPPCQGFSLAGKRLTDDPRNYLYKHFLQMVEAIQPACVVMENVPNLLNHPEVAQSIHQDFQDLNVPKKYKYSVDHATVNAAGYGVPQTRSRVIFVARRGDVVRSNKFILKAVMDPLFTGRPELFGSSMFITVDEAISDLPEIYAGQGADEMPYDQPARTVYQSLMRGEKDVGSFFMTRNLPAPRYREKIKRSKAVFNHQAQKHSALLIERFANIPPGGSKEDLRRKRPDLLPPEGHPEQGMTYGRLWPDRPAPTIPANYSRPSGNRSIHPHQPRLITPREAMRLSSFPDYYRLAGGMVAQREQVGNAVPPLMAYHLAVRLRELIDI